MIGFAYFPLPRLGKTAIRFVIDRVLNLLFAYPTDSWEFASGSLLTVMGAWSLANPEMYEIGLYRHFQAAAIAVGVDASLLWGGAFLVVGIAKLGSLLFSKFDEFRVVTSAVAAFVWITLAYNFARHDWQLFETPVFTFFSFMSTLVWMRLVLHRRDFSEYCEAEDVPQ